MDSELLNNLRGLSTILVMIAFFSICWWAYSPKRRAKFKEASNLPFSDELDGTQANASQQPTNTTGTPEAGHKGQEKS